MVGTMTSKSNKKNKVQNIQQHQLKGTKKEGISTSTATIIAAMIGLIGVIIGAVLNYRSEHDKILLPIYVTQTAQSTSYTQTALAFNPIVLLSSTPVFTPTISLTESPTAQPELALNVTAPTRDNLSIVPIMYVHYEDINTPNTQTYKVNVSSKVTYLWTYIWCAKHEGTLNENLNQMDFSFFIDDVQIPEDRFLIFKEPSIDNWPCQRWTTMLSGWDVSHFPTLSIVYNIPTPLSDGVVTYSIGEYRHQIKVTILD